jgi:hypothetical protein
MLPRWHVDDELRPEAAAGTDLSSGNRFDPAPACLGVRRHTTIHNSLRRFFPVGAEWACFQGLEAGMPISSGARQVLARRPQRPGFPS